MVCVMRKVMGTGLAAEEAMPSSCSADLARRTQRLTASDPCRRLNGVGPKLVDKLATLGIVSIGDVLLHRPSRYEDRTRVTPIAEMMPQGMPVIAVVRIEAAEVRYGRRRSLLVSTTGIYHSVLVDTHKRSNPFYTCIQIHAHHQKQHLISA